MALPDSFKYVIGTPLVIADTTYADNNGFGARTDQMNASGLTAGGARQSAKLDFLANMDLELVLGAAVAFAATAVAGEVVDYYMAWSASATAGLNNPGGISGVDDDYAGYAGSNLEDSLKQLGFLGSFVVVAGTAVQIDTDIATFSPRERYGTLVEVNRSVAAAFVASAVNLVVRLQPLTLQVQE